jgi:hypothetical protein
VHIIHWAVINFRRKVNYLRRIKPIYKLPYTKASQGGMDKKVRYRDIICFVITSIQWGGLVGEREVSQGRRVVVGLVKLYFGTWKGVTVDNFFT